MWQMIGLLAEPERRLMSERTCSGVDAAKHRGMEFGRKPNSRCSNSTTAAS
jgi:DNA invertase Pin-like site-specific DNA recombinase